MRWFLCVHGGDAAVLDEVSFLRNRDNYFFGGAVVFGGHVGELDWLDCLVS